MDLKTLQSRNVTVFIVLILITAISGCATQMPLTEDVSQINIESEGIAIMVLKISNQYAPDYQPIVERIWVTELGENQDYAVIVRDAYERIEKQYNKYLISVQLPPGKYKIGEISGSSFIGPIGLIVPLSPLMGSGSGDFEFPLDAEFELSSNEIAYIGHVEMVNRERNDGETRSGGVFPLMDQEVTGFHRGTFYIEISDKYDDDVKLFKGTYPCIENMEVSKHIAVLSSKKSQ